MKDKWKVLLIDDESEFHQLLRAAFPELELYSAYTIEGGNWLITQSRSPFDLIFLDLNLHEDAQAFEKLKQISRITFSPVIVVSTYADHNARFEVQKRGASDFLSKGNFDLNAWLGIIKKVLAGVVREQAGVFLFYAKEDRKFAHYLSDKLMESRINVRLNDVSSNVKPTPLHHSHIRKTDMVVMALSPEALLSNNLQGLIDEAVRLEGDKRILGILPILIKPCMVPEKLEKKLSVSFVDNNAFPVSFKTFMEALKR